MRQLYKGRIPEIEGGYQFQQGFQGTMRNYGILHVTIDQIVCSLFINLFLHTQSIDLYTSSMVSDTCVIY